ncbi:sodium- and chloride-dependent GABA transporter 1-like [Agrilus planipennis]|uniref:Sodium- and chloride-dependent GABA transporter 1-like n=1 Tax=Agrilus planipennis TaxID=224129 RepID=A0A1W4WU71_AGRPL|nr:sodium- and chloride-dependent GABA transporter 1-like [Agrilus planipennis]
MSTDYFNIVNRSYTDKKKTDDNEDVFLADTKLKQVKHKRIRNGSTYIPRTEDYFATRYQYILFSVLMANDSSFIQYLFTHSLFISGGGFLIIYIFTTILIGIPIIYVEIFLGRYTKKSSSQMYRMSPFFLGFCVSVLAINVFHQAKQSSEYSRFIAQFLDLMSDKSMYDKCDDKNTSWCYDYKIRGKVNDECVRSFMGMNCTKLGIIAYPFQYAYYNTYGATDHVHYPQIKVFIVIGIIWFVVWLLSFRGIRGLGYSLNITFICQLSICVVSFIIIFTLEGYEDGIYHLLEIDYSSITHIADVWLSVWFCVINLGLIIPSGYMTFAAYSTSGRGVGMDCMIITLFIALYGIFMTLFFYCLTGTLARAIGCCMECVVVPGRGIYQAMIPELFSYIDSPSILFILYFMSLFLNDIIGMTMCAYGIILSLFDFFPKLQNFRFYVWIISCTLMAATSMGLYGRLESVREWIPVTQAVYTEYIVGLCLNIEAIILFYVYGVSRLTDDILFYTGEPPVKFLRMMWALIPILLFVCNILMWLNRYLLSIYNDIIENNEKEIRRVRFNAGLFYLAIFCFGLFTCIWYYLINIEKKNFFIHLLKPQYHWGPPDQLVRKERKHFYPRISIRSQVQYPRSNKLFVVSAITEREQPTSTEMVENEQTKKGKIFEDRHFFFNIGVDRFTKNKRK